MADARVVVVTDPMCAWCWGMTRDLEAAMAALAGEAEFDFMLGGINPDGTQPIGDYGRRFLFRLWRDVHATTRAPFGDTLPDAYVHNSRLACVAVEAVRELSGAPPFGYLHRLQELFFVEGRNVADRDELAAAAAEFGWQRAQLEALLDDARIRQRVQFQFEHSRGYGTNALPNVLIELEGTMQLLAGGYVDADMLTGLVRARLDA